MSECVHGQLARSCDLCELEGEIKRLLGRDQEASGCLASYQAANQQLRATVKELSIQLALTGDHIDDQISEEDKIATAKYSEYKRLSTEMIGSLTAELAEKDKRILELERIVCGAREELMKELGILRCGACDGKARGWIDNDPDAEGSYEAACPGCQGHGWEIGEVEG